MDEFVQEILAILKSSQSIEEKKKALEDYHENDIAKVVHFLNDSEREELFKILDQEDLSEVISYVEDADEIIENLDSEKAADILEDMDADDAVDILETLDEDDQAQVLAKMDEEAREDAQLILSYNEDQVGRLMTTNFIVINKDDNVTIAMKKLIEQSGDNDNITTIFVVDENNNYYAALDLKDLIKARKNDNLADLFVVNYPSVKASAEITEVYQDIIDYGENIIPVLDDNEVLIGALTSHDLVEVVDSEKNEDYEKFAAINGNVDLHSSVFISIKKRLPWLILLLFLGFIVSILIGSFSNVISTVTTLVFFQSVVLDMAGNAGTQSLAVTIRILSDENVNRRLIGRLIFKEFRVGLLNGLVLGAIGFISSFLYLLIFKQPLSSDVNSVYGVFSINSSLIAAGIISFSIMIAMTLSSLVGTCIPIFFHSIKIDPAAASGPLITTFNDLIAVSVYYGLSILLIVRLINWI